MALTLFPGDEHTPSGRMILAMLPSGAAAAVARRPRPRVSSYEVSLVWKHAKEADKGALPILDLCGVCHVEPASAIAARNAVLRQASTAGGLAAVALECDA